MTEIALYRRVAVDTPEHVRIDYVLADLGSRIGAFAVDLVLLSAVLTVLAAALISVANLGPVAESLGTTALVVVLFLAQWGYFMLFEGLWGGRTPGKRTLGLRVVQVGGEALSLRGAVLRNLLRAVDLQPAPSGLAGLVSILASRRAQRLGDLVAGTMVVQDTTGRSRIEAIEPASSPWIDSREHRERRSTPLARRDEGPIAAALLVRGATQSAAAQRGCSAARMPWEVCPRAANDRVGRPVLSPAHFELLASYAARREGLSGRVRERVSEALLEALRPTIGEDYAASDHSADATLLRLHADEGPRHAARSGARSLQAAALAREQQEEWSRYAELVRRGGKGGLAGLSESELRAFGRLYRGLTADLARVRTYGAGPELVGALERWVGAGHNLLYRRRRRIAHGLGRWLAVGFPRAVRRHRIPVLLATALFYGPAGMTFAAVRGDPLLGRTMVGSAMLTRAENTVKGDPAARYLERDVAALEMPVLSAALTTNNVGVTFLAFAGGLLAGAGTLAVLLLNGLMLGSVLGAYANEGVLTVILAFVFPHGFVELTAICIAGGAGFGLGSALLVPGRLTRADALRARGRDLLALLLGAAVMLVVAGVIEGLYSPLALPATAKFAFGGSTAVLLAAYFGLAGRKDAPEG